MPLFLSKMFEKFAELTPSTIAVLSLLIIVGIGGTILIRKSKEVNFTTRMLVYASVCIALSFVLSYIRLFRMPQGGSITPGSMLPIMAFAYIFGPVPGVIAGMAYGLLQYIQDSYMVHWIQFFVDYPIAFGFLGLAGVYRKNLAVGSFIAVFGRFLMHFLSGIIFFAEYAEGPVVLYSLGYNGTYLAVEFIICVVIAMMPQVRSMLQQLQKSYSLKA
jgi:thiamine transporter